MAQDKDKAGQDQQDHEEPEVVAHEAAEDNPLADCGAHCGSFAME